MHFPPNSLQYHQLIRDYRISGVFHMRFMQDIDIPRNYQWKTQVMRNVRAAAESTGRVFAVSYNIAGKLDDGVLDKMKNDWINLVDNEQVTQSGRYIHHSGRPVLRIYGIGFKAVRFVFIHRLFHEFNFSSSAPFVFSQTSPILIR